MHYIGRISCRFPSPADDHLDEAIDLNREYIKNNSFTYYGTYGEIRECVSTYSAKLRRAAVARSAFSYTPIRIERSCPSTVMEVTIRHPFATNSMVTIIKSVMDGLKKIYRDGYSCKKAGLVAMDVATDSGRQPVIFCNPDPIHPALMSMIDGINKTTHGRLRFAGQDPIKT